MGKESYAPVSFDVNAELAEAMDRPGFKEAYDSLEEEYSALASFFEARKMTGLTQEDVAVKMGTTKSAVSRLESSLGDNRHSPSIATLRKYAKAIGCRLDIRLLPQ
jgi:DNA-binding XRE family transcriptional regulator